MTTEATSQIEVQDPPIGLYAVIRFGFGSHEWWIELDSGRDLRFSHYRRDVLALAFHIDIGWQGKEYRR